MLRHIYYEPFCIVLTADLFSTSSRSRSTDASRGQRALELCSSTPLRLRPTGAMAGAAQAARPLNSWDWLGGC